MNNDSALKKVKLALAELNNEALKNENEWVFCSLQQVLMFRQELELMITQLENNTSHPLAQRTGMGHVITDSWPLGSTLGTLILEAEHEYLSAVQ